MKRAALQSRPCLFRLHAAGACHNGNLAGQIGFDDIFLHMYPPFYVVLL